MKVTKIIEYYASCPKCGAPNTGAKERCEFCDALMIKSETEEYDKSINNIEEQNEMEDCELEIIKGKSAQGNVFMVIFGLIFGGSFIIIPTAICGTFISVGMMEVWLWGFFAIFWMVGLGAIIPAIAGFVRQMICSAMGEEITAEVRGYENSMVEINGRPAKKVRLKIYENGRYKIVSLDTGSPNRKYPIGRNVKVKRYKNYFKIL